MSYLDNSENLKEVREFYLERLLKPKLTSERARLITQSYQETQGDPMILRRAKGLKKILGEMTIYIEPWELIVGNLGPEPVSAPIFPEGGVDFILDELDTYETREGDKFKVSEDTKNELREILAWWNGKTLKDYGFNLMPPWVRKQTDAGLFKAENMLTCGTGHFLPDYRKILHWGFEAIERYSKDRLDSLPLTSMDTMEKRFFYEACLIIIEGIRIFASRYAKLAEDMAVSETDSERTRELSIIADACKRVPMKPATNFFEALQSIWFTHVINYIDSNGYGVTLGRTARDLYPFYEISLERGEVTREHARTYLMSFMFKCNDILKLYNNTAAKLYGGFPVGEPVQLGGLGTDDKDDTNEVSELFLEAEERVRLYQPDIGILWTNNMKDDFLLKAVNLVSTSHKPKFFNYHVGGEMYLRAGIPMEEARTNWGFIGCVELGIPGKMWTWADAAVFNLAKCLELALNDGADFRTGEKIGLAPGEGVTKFASFSQVINAFKDQVSHALELLAQGVIALQIAHKEIWPEPYQSMLVDGCVERGREANSGGAQYYQTGVQFVGFATVVDSLMAIKKFVFQREETTMDGLVGTLKNNYKDNEILRHKLLNETPKFGNDIDEVDELACEVCSFCCDEISKHKDIWGTPFTASFYTVTSHIAFGDFVGATPDGRFAYTPLSDATSPAQGAVKNGATAVLKSEAKLPHYKATNGTLLNMKFNKQLFKTQEGLNCLASLIKVFFNMGGFHVQFNVVDAETLRDAQKHPERYTDFLVRVAAYVTNWNQLSKQIQDEIISRTELEAFS